MSRTSFIVLAVALLIGCLLALDQQPPKFVTAGLQDVINQLAHEQSIKQAANQTMDLSQSIAFIQTAMKEKYGDLVDINDEWMFNLAGGFKTGLLLLHASMTEYVAIWGSQVPTTGHSGRNWATFEDWIIQGTGHWWHEGGLDTESHQSYQYIFTERFAGRILHLEAGTFMFEHCHGVIPALLPFGVMDSMVSSLDPLLFARQLHAYGRLTLANLMRGVI